MKRYAIIKHLFVDTAKEETSVFDPNRLLYLCSSDADSSQAATSSNNGVETTRQKRSSRQISVRWHTVHMLQSQHLRIVLLNTPCNRKRKYIPAANSSGSKGR